jgi:hypothetical protein
MDKDKNPGKKRRGNKNKKRGKKPQGPMAVVRQPCLFRGLRARNVIEFQGQPMMVKNVVTTENGGVKLSLSRALHMPETDRDVKVGRSAVKHYEEWSFTARPLSPQLRVDRFQLVPADQAPKRRKPKAKGRKREGAAA